MPTLLCFFLESDYIYTENGVCTPGLYPTLSLALGTSGTVRNSSQNNSQLVQIVPK